MDRYMVDVEERRVYTVVVETCMGRSHAKDLAEERVRKGVTKLPLLECNCVNSEDWHVMHGTTLPLTPDE